MDSDRGGAEPGRGFRGVEPEQITGAEHNIRGGTEYSPVRNKQEDTSNIVRIRKNI